MIQYFPIVTGSLVVLGNVSVSGSINASGSVTISGSIASASFASTASFVTLSQTASFVANAQSASNAVSAATASSADNFLTRGTLTAQTLVVQTITSSIDYVTGSTRFGSLSSNTHDFTGSVRISGSLTSTGSITTIAPTGNANLIIQTLQAAQNTQIQFVNTAKTVYIGNQIASAGSMFEVHDASLGASRLLISSSGNVGIGTTTPTTLLHVSGTTGGLLEIDGASAVNALYVSASGRVGIGTTGPLSLLDVTVLASGARRLFVNYDDSLVTIKSANNSSTAESLRVWGDNIYFYTGSAGSELMRLTNTGRVGIGTSTPSGSRLHVFIGNDGGSGIPGTILATSNGVNDIVRFQDGTTTVAVVKNDGRFGMGTTNTSTEANLHLGANGASEGGQLILQKATSYASASHLDNYQNRFRILSGNDTTSAAERFSVDMATGAVLIAQGTAPTYSGGNLFMLGNTILFDCNTGVGSPYTSNLRVDIVWTNWGGNNVAALVDVDFLAREWANLGGVSFGRIYALSSGGATTFNNTINTTNVTTANATLTVSSPANYTLRLLFSPTNNKDSIGCCIRIPASAAGTQSSVASITATLV